MNSRINITYPTWQNYHINLDDYATYSNFCLFFWILQITQDSPRGGDVQSSLTLLSGQFTTVFNWVTFIIAKNISSINEKDCFFPFHINISLFCCLKMNSIHSKTRKTFWYQNSWPKTIIFLLRCLKFPNAQICFGNDYLRSVMQLGNGLISWSYNGSQYGAPPVGSFLHSITIYLFVLFSFGSPGADAFLNLSIVAGKLAYSVHK